MSPRTRILTFGFLSGLLWSVAPLVLADLFRKGADIPGIVVPGIMAGILVSAILASVVAKTGRGMAFLFGLLSLPAGAFVFGFCLALTNRFLPILNDTPALAEPWTLGLFFMVTSVLSVAAIGLFPLAVGTTFLLRVFIRRSTRIDALRPAR